MAMSSFAGDLTFFFFAYLPLMMGAYISILILRFPDLTIEASWCIGGITACSMVSYCHPLLASLFGLFAGAVCGVLTSVIFSFTGRTKLLSGLISYTILEAVGFHLLGSKSSIFLNRSESMFGFSLAGSTPVLIYALWGIVVTLVVCIWQSSQWGIKTRLIGENPGSSLFFKLPISRHFAGALILSNALVGLGGGLWGLYFGHASNMQGIGLVLKAFLALLLGDEMLRLLRVTKRSVPLAAIVGTGLFVLLYQLTEKLQVYVATRVSEQWLKPNDKQFVVALVLVMLLFARRSKIQDRNSVSDW